MTSKTVTSLAFAAGCVLALGAMPSAQAQAPLTYQPAPPAQAYEAAPPQLVTNGPQASRGDFGDWSARQNVIESRHYDRLLQTNIAFRRFRMRKECGPISDPQLRGQCFASFQQYEPVMYGSSIAPRMRYRHYRHYRHRARYYRGARVYRSTRYTTRSERYGAVGTSAPPAPTGVYTTR